VPSNYNASTFFEAAPLHTLSISLSTLNNIRDLGCLSRLQKLNIYYEDTPGSFESLTVPGLEWPNLHQLSIYSLHEVEPLKYLWGVPALVGKLTTVRLQFRDGASARWEMLAAMLAKGSPNIETLLLAPRGSFEDPGSIVELFISRLALRNLQIWTTDCPHPGHIDLWDRLLKRTFGSIETLELGAYREDILDLQSYALSMPKLKHLRVQLLVGRAGRHK
jgi:hypothetical protein